MIRNWKAKYGGAMIIEQLNNFQIKFACSLPCTIVGMLLIPSPADVLALMEIEYDSVNPRLPMTLSELSGATTSIITLLLLRRDSIVVYVTV